eukprot:COSAG06_NODE_1936_length_8030_cov_4.318245_6_plen_85_part_00
MDAMSDAIEGAGVMLYGVSLPYKESANVRSQEAAAHPSVHPCCSHSCVCLCVLLVPLGGQLRTSAKAGHDSADDGKRLQAAGVA